MAIPIAAIQLAALPLANVSTAPITAFLSSTDLFNEENTMSAKQRTANEGYISLSVRASVLKRMLSGENLHLSDIHCSNKKSKLAVQKLLLQALSEGE